MENKQEDMITLEEGEKFTVTIDRVAAGGEGIARVQGITVFVSHTAPADIVEIEITQVAKKFARGRLLNILTSAPERVSPRCPLAGKCPGCQLQHINYQAQLAIKQTVVQDAFQRIGHLNDVPVLPVIGMENPWEYRNKGEFAAEIVAGKIQLGYRADGEGGFVELPDCPLHHPLTMEIVRATEIVANEFQLPLAQLITRVDADENKALAILVCREWDDALNAAAERLQQLLPSLTGVLWSRVRGKSLVRRTPAELLAGERSLVYTLAPWEYSVSAEAFFQVNLVQAKVLVETVLQMAGDLSAAIALDGYCGVGTFLLPIAARAARSIGIEENPAAFQDAQINLTRYAMHDVKMYQGKVETILRRAIRKGRHVDVMVLDPPRKGAGREVLAMVAELQVRKLVMVSCDPATLARDASDLDKFGYQITSVQPVDMFPQTWHIESVALAELK